jgi:Fe2+ transport system protein FeoA
VVVTDEERMEKNIQSLGIGDKGRISRIDGPGLRERMKKLGIREGAIVERLGPPAHSGCVEIKTGQRRVTLGLGIAMKLRVTHQGRSVGILEMQPGERGVISSIQGGQRIVEILKGDFEIATGSTILMVGPRQDRDFQVEIRGKRWSLCEGDASKILVKKGRRIQLNYLKAGDEAQITSIAAGLRARSMLREFGIEEGLIIRIVRITQSDFREPEAPIWVRAGGQELTIGYGMAEKIWLDVIHQAEEKCPTT